MKNITWDLQLTMKSVVTFLSRSCRGVLDTALCDKVYQCSGSPINKTHRHDITEILLKWALNCITPNAPTF